MEDYRRKVALVCLPFAIAQKTQPLNKLYFILDSADYLENMSKKSTKINLVNCGDSCAIDSVLTALFSHFKLFPKEYENKTRENISKWFSSIEAKTDISSLVPMFKSFPHEDNFHALNEPKDAIEFLMYLFKIFNRDITGTKIFKTINVRGTVTCARVDKESSPIQYISAVELEERKNSIIWVQDLIDNETSVHDRKKTREELVQGDLVVFACGRITYTGKFVTTPVIATPSLTTPNGDRFFLGSIVVSASANHYRSYVRDGNKWFLYDDLHHQTLNGTFSYDEMMSGPNSPKTTGVLYMYFPDYSCAEEHTISTWKIDGKTEELFVGVFEDRVTNKLLNLVSDFDCVFVGEPLHALKVLTKNNGGGGGAASKKMTILSVTEFLRLDK